MEFIISGLVLGFLTSFHCIGMINKMNIIPKKEFL
jgi:hypothetical protein